MEIKTIGIIGYGHFGQFVHSLCERFLTEVEVRVYSKNDMGCEATVSLETVASSSVIFLCTPISAYKAVLEEILPYLGEQSVLVDVATVKKHTTELFQEKLVGKRWLSCHPMFGMESYKKTDGDISGYRIVVTDHALKEEEYDAAREWLTNLGFLLIEMSADEHDKLLAETLFMTHYIGQTMNTAGFQRTEIDTVSFQSLMNAVESVAQDGQLFADVYKYNPYCETAAVRFHQAQSAVLETLAKGK